MALIHVMLGTAHIYLSAGETKLAMKELSRAYSKLLSMRQTRKVHLMRVHLVQCMERVRGIKCSK